MLTHHYFRARHSGGMRGFTLIELLSVIAIIGILASVAIASFVTAREKSRDGKRIAQIGQITKALELYYDSHQSYPSTTPDGFIGADAAIQLLASQGLLPPNPVPPPGVDMTYLYHGVYGLTAPYSECDGTAPSGTACTSYALGITLEQEGNSVLVEDADQTLGGVFFGDSAECRNAVAGVEHCFDVKP